MPSAVLRRRLRAAWSSPTEEYVVSTSVPCGNAHSIFSVCPDWAWPAAQLSMPEVTIDARLW